MLTVYCQKLPPSVSGIEVKEVEGVTFKSFPSSVPNEDGEYIAELDAHCQRLAPVNATISKAFIMNCIKRAKEIITGDLRMIAIYDKDNDKLLGTVEKLPPLPDQVTVNLAIHGPRPRPGVKSTSWAVERKALEAAMPEDCNETLLVDPDGYIYEGLSSNFVFVTYDRVFRGAPSECILEGTILKLVKEVCEDMAIKFTDDKPPNVRELSPDRCYMAFICSTSRLVLPISQFNIDSKTTFRPTWSSSNLLLTVQNRVYQLLKARATKVE